MEEIKWINDEEGHRHFLKEKLGQGGQGAVYKTRDENIVIKVVLDEAGNIVKDEKKYNEYKRSIDEIRVLDLPKGINIAKPILMLEKPYHGYIMRLVNDMIPIKKIMIPGDEGLAEFYLRTGGIYKRLRLLKNLASILFKLHSRSIIYGDISPENIFISKSLDYYEVWLIDADNMRYRMDFLKAIYTPGYGAPEIVNNISTNNTYSDVYSFALLAYELLTTISPFEGELVINGGEEESWDCDDTGTEENSEDFYAKAERGELPWVNDLIDTRNYNDKGIPPKIVISKGIMELFQKTFSYVARNHANERPSMREWYDAIDKASCALIYCKKCKNAFYIGTDICPFCDETKDRAYLAQIYDILNLNEIVAEINSEGYAEKYKLEEKEINNLRIKRIGVVAINKLTYLFAEQVKNTYSEDSYEEKAISIYNEGNSFTIENHLNIRLNIYENNKFLISLEPEKKIEVKELEKILVSLKFNEFKERRIFFRKI